jgi:pimeloyl-ACP methyl ester carboxylesterase
MRRLFHALQFVIAALLAGCASFQVPLAPETSATPAGASLPTVSATPAITATPTASVPHSSSILPTYAGVEPLGVAMEGWVYPYPLQMMQFRQHGQILRMMYMDVQSAHPNGQTVLLFHGKNFGSDYWAHTIRALSERGYRVIAPDQIGFGRSSKPETRYTFEQLVSNTTLLLDNLKVGRTAAIANSMGGMLAVHFVNRHPERVTALILEDPLGLEDYRQSIPPQNTATLVKLEMAQTPESYRKFLKGYFPNWKPEYELLVEQFARVQQSGEYPRFAHVSALTYQMIYEGPIFNELPKLKVPTLLVIGQLDRTVFGRRFAPPEVVKPLGNFPVLGQAAQKVIPGAKLVEFEGVGHVPHMEVPEQFNAAAIEFLSGKR